MRKYLTCISGADLRRHYAARAWESTTLLDVVIRRAEDAPAAPALRDSRVTLDNARLLRAVAGTAGLLRTRGVLAGDPVLIQLRNGAAFAVAAVAVSAVGAVIVPVKTSTSSSENAAIAERIRAKAVVTSTEFSARAADAAAAGLSVITDDDVWGAAGRAAPGWEPEDSAADPDEPLNVMFSSGTTGTPKGIVNTTNTQLSSIRAMNAELGLDAQDSWLVVPPMAHNAGWLYSFLPALVSGAVAVFQERFDPRDTLALLHDHEIRNVFLTPTHAADVLQTVAHGAEAPTALRRVLIGGATTAPEMKAALRTQLNAEVVAMYGSTENQGATYTRPGRDVSHADQTAGWPCPLNSVAIFGLDQRTPVAPNEIGEIGTRGPGTFAGYYADQAATDAAFNADGWFLTGDLGFLDDRGALHLTGRRKELIIRGGLNIAPDDVELALAGFPGLDRVAAIGLPDQRLGEIVCAVVVSRADVDLRSLTEHLRARNVGMHLWPEALLRVDDFPLTDIGKVQRRRLRELAEDAWQRGAVERARAHGVGASSRQPPAASRQRHRAAPCSR